MVELCPRRGPGGCQGYRRCRRVGHHEDHIDMTTEATATPVDGRTRRRRRNIDAVVDAVIELAAAGHIDPTSEEIAAVAGISHRSIYRYFDTRGELLEAAVARAFETASAEVFDDERLDGSFDERVDRFVSARLEIHRRLRSIARVAEAHASESSTGLERARSALRTAACRQLRRRVRPARARGSTPRRADGGCRVPVPGAGIPQQQRWSRRSFDSKVARTTPPGSPSPRLKCCTE